MVRLVRHAKSSINEASSIGLREHVAGLSEEGLRQIPELRNKITDILGGRILEDITVNVSELWRTRQTAHEVGFVIFRTMPLLNESLEAAPLRKLLPRMQAGWLPHDALRDAERFLNNPELHEEFNFTHGLKIAACRYVAGERPLDGNTRHLVPFYAEIVEIAT